MADIHKPDTDAEWLRHFVPMPLSIKGAVQQNGRKYVELTDADRDRLWMIARRLDDSVPEEDDEPQRP